MAIISESYINRLLRDYIKSDAGQEKISQFKKDVFDGVKSGGKGLLTKDDLYQYLFDIKTMFWEAVKNEIPSFERSYDEIHAESDYYDDGGVYARISVDENALYRSSLHYMNKSEFNRSGGLTIDSGEGVDDIVALFTHGYTITGRRPFGFWVHEGGESMSRIGALMHRDPNPFLKILVAEINKEYAGVCKATLDEEYQT